MSATIQYTVCGHCGRDVTVEGYHACKWCSQPICEACGKKNYCPRTKELFPHPPTEADEEKKADS